MYRFRKSICMLLALTIMLAMVVLPANASVEYSEDPQAQKNYKLFGAPASTEETLTAAAETVGAETAETKYAETPAAVIPTETKAAETQTTVKTQVPAKTEASAEAQVPAETQAAMTTSRTAAASGTTVKAEQTDEPQGHNGVPLYFQTDYPNNMYGIGTIANNGCGATCLAMVATYLTGHEYLPDEIARYFGGAAENNIARLEYGSETMQLPYKKAKNWHETIAAVQEGKIAIVLMGSTSLFTDSQHFIVLTGLNEEGKIMVNDPMESNYSKWDIKKGLREGFDNGDIMLGYSGAWIYDKSAMPEEPYLYSEPLPVRGEPRYDIELTWEEIQLLAKVVWVEARGECNEGQQAVAEVALNRLASDDFPDTLWSVIYGENQFRSAKFLDEAEPYQLQYEMIENALYGPYVLPEDVYYFATTAKTDKVWGQIGGHIFCYAED